MKKYSIVTFLILFIYLLTSAQSTIILTHSSITTHLINSTSTTATQAAYNYGKTISRDNNAIFIWDGNGSNSGCPMDITVQQIIHIKCLNQNIYLYITCDNQYTAYINGNLIGTGTNFQNIDAYTISTTNYNCGQDINLTIKATNIPEGMPGCQANPAGLIFSLLSDDCPICQANQFFDDSVCGCSYCSQYLSNCNTCTSNITCTTCIVGYTVNYVSSLCSPCSNYIIGCLTCSSTSICTSCDTSGYFVLSGGLCSCQSGYIMVSSSCYSCSNYMVGCQSCTSINTCSTCNTSGNFILVSNNCNCNTGYAINGTSCQTCQTTLVGCINCASINSCSICNITKKFYLSGNTCVCNNGFFWNSIDFFCQQLCGDGLLFELQCDDGNNINGDGCSSNCTVQTKYICVNGSYQTPSVCGYNYSLDLVMISQLKDITSNSITLYISLSPNINSFSTLPNLVSYVSLNMSNSCIKSASYQNGVLSVSISYNSTIQLLEGRINLAGNINYSKLFALSPSTLDFTVSSNNNQAVAYYDEFVYTLIPSTIKIITVIQGTSLCSLAVGMFASKIISLQLINIMQIAYIQLSTIHNINPVMSTLYYLKYINGYNKMKLTFLGLSQSHRLLDVVNTQSIQQNLSQLQYNYHLVQNFNYMYILLIVIFAIGIIIRLLSLVSKCYQTSLHNLSTFILKEFMFIVLYFNVNNMAFSFGIHCQYLSSGQLWNTALIISQIIAISSVIFFIVYIVYFALTLKDFGQFNEKYKQDKLSQLHSSIFMIFRYLIGFITGYFNQYPQICFAIVGLQFSFMIYVSVKQPYVEGIENVRASLNELIILYMVIVNMYYRNFNKYSDTSAKQMSPSYLDLCLIIFSVILNLCLLGYQFLKKYRTIMEKKKIHQENVLEQKKKETNSKQIIQIQKKQDPILIQQDTNNSRIQILQKTMDVIKKNRTLIKKYQVLGSDSPLKRETQNQNKIKQFENSKRKNQSMKMIDI